MIEAVASQVRCSLKQFAVIFSSLETSVECEMFDFQRASYRNVYHVLVLIYCFHVSFYLVVQTCWWQNCRPFLQFGIIPVHKLRYVGRSLHYIFCLVQRGREMCRRFSKNRARRMGIFGPQNILGPIPFELFLFQAHLYIWACRKKETRIWTQFQNCRPVCRLRICYGPKLKGLKSSSRIGRRGKWIQSLSQHML